jgi:mRNA interferase RelE/StbE
LSDWRVQLTGPARRDLRRLDPPIQRRVRTALGQLQANPTAGDVRRLTGSSEWRLRVGDWRIRFVRDEGERLISVIRILPRGRAYRD